MILETKEKLLNRKSEYLSIGITPEGTPRAMIEIPWEGTAHAFNMRGPNVYLPPEELKDEEVLSLLETYRVIGCYIFTALDDYSFLARFKDLQDIRIENGDNVRDLDFLSGLYECRMLCLENAKLENLNTIVELKKNSKLPFGCLRCVALFNCEVADLSAFASEKLQFSEFLVWRPEGSNEEDRWSGISAGTFRYYEYQV